VTNKCDMDMSSLDMLVHFVDVISLEEALGALPPTHHLPHNSTDSSVAQCIHTSNHHTSITYQHHKCYYPITNNKKA